MIKRIYKKLYHNPPAYFVNYYKTKRLKLKSKPILQKYLKAKGIKKLQIGCGYNILEGWLNTDLIYRKNEVAYLDAGKKFPLPDESFDYIYSEHIFEHLTLTQGLSMLRECYRVLKPGGHIRLATPDLDFLINMYNDPKKKIHQEYVIWSTENFIKEVSNNFNEDEYLTSFVVNNFFRDWYHKVIYNFESLKLVLEKTGFTEIQRKEIGQSDIEVFSGLEKHGEIIPEAFNDLETIVVEAEKSS